MSQSEVALTHYTHVIPTTHQVRGRAKTNQQTSTFTTTQTGGMYTQQKELFSGFELVAQLISIQSLLSLKSDYVTDSYYQFVTYIRCTDNEILVVVQHMKINLLIFYGLVWQNYIKSLMQKIFKCLLYFQKHSKASKEYRL